MIKGKSRVVTIVGNIVEKRPLSKPRNSKSNEHEFKVWQAGQANPILNPYLPEWIEYDAIDNVLRMPKYKAPQTVEQRKKFWGSKFCKDAYNKMFEDLRSVYPLLKKKHVHLGNVGFDEAKQLKIFDLADLYYIIEVS